MNYVYILESGKNGRYYIGSTNNLERRIAEHNSGKTKSLKHLIPLHIVFQQGFPTAMEARRAERKLKRYKSKEILRRIITDKYISGL